MPKPIVILNTRVESDAKVRQIVESVRRTFKLDDFQSKYDNGMLVISFASSIAVSWRVKEHINAMNG